MCKREGRGKRKKEKKEWGLKPNCPSKHHTRRLTWKRAPCSFKRHDKSWYSSTG